MLSNVKPNRKRSKAGGLTLDEKRLAKGLLNLGYFVQDIVFIINQGRDVAINQSAVHPLSADSKIQAADKEVIQKYLKIQAAYNPKTLLNPYKDQRLIKAREAMISAVQIFNSPNMLFKTEIFSVLANIAWTYLLHQKIEENKKGASVLGNGKSISVNELLQKQICPIDAEPVKENLIQVIKIRDSVEHIYHPDIDKCFGMVFQACCINFNYYLTKWFGKHLSLENELSLALQFVGLKKEQFIELEGKDYPPELLCILHDIENNPYKESTAFVAKVFYTLESTSKTSSDIHHLIDYDSLPDGVTPDVVAIRKVSRTKLTQAQVIKLMHKKGYPKFSSYEHQLFWQSKWKNADVRKKKASGVYGEDFNGWGWFEDKWMPEVTKYCESSGDKFK